MKRKDILRDHQAVVDGYEMHLYCQHPEARPYYLCSTPDEFAGVDRADVVRQAKRAGWWISRPDKEGRRAVLCPYHNKQVHP